MAKPLRTRFAPTPSGYLHLGNAFNFQLTSLEAKKENGTILLRIDDLDAARVEQQYVDDIFNTLQWLGLDWDEGPRDSTEHFSKFSQELRKSRYHELIGQLKNDGHLFACTCSRKEVLEKNKSGRYSGTCQHKNLPFDTPDAAWRLKRDDDEMAYPIIRRRDGIPSSTIASLADDTDQQINLIVRGTDLLPVTKLQLHLAELLGLKEFGKTRFIHHPLLQDKEGNKLSKSAGSLSLKAMRESGITAEEVYRLFENWQKGK